MGLYKQERLKRIKTIEIGLTSKCNLKCPLCTRNKDLFKMNWKFEPKDIDYIKLITFINYIKPEEVKLVGAVGEPTLYPHFFKLLKFLKENNIKIWLSTNGVTHSTKWWKMVRDLIPTGSVINIDLDHTEEDKQLYRRGTNLTKLKENLKEIANNPNYIVRAQRIDFDWNKDNYDYFQTEVLKWGFDEVYNIPCYNFKQEEFTEDLTFWSHPKQKDYELLDRMNKLNQTRDNIVCESNREGLIYVNYLGEITPCCYINDLVLQSPKPDFNNIHFVNNYENIITEYFERIDNPETSWYKTTCKKFCTKINRQLYKEFNLDP